MMRWVEQEELVLLFWRPMTPTFALAIHFAMATLPWTRPRAIS
jgi:hypothetical protein